VDRANRSIPDPVADTTGDGTGIASPASVDTEANERPVDPRSQGFRLSWSSNALIWSAAIRRLLHSQQMAEVRLAVVALNLYLSLTDHLVAGYALVPADDTARDSYPGDPRELRRIQKKVSGLRDEILHFADKTDDGREVSVSWGGDPQEVTIKSSVGRQRGSFGKASIMRSEIEELLDRLDPWLRAEYRRLLDAREAESPPTEPA
jgi:hypothetical protein